VEAKVAVVAGIGREGQLGESVAHTLGERGYVIAAIARTREEADARVRALRQGGLDAHAFGCDLADPGDVTRAASEVGRVANGAVGALVHVAGGFGASGKVAESDPAQWHHQIAINLTTAYLTTRAFLPLLRRRGGSIVYFSSVAALPNGRPREIAAYAAAKSGVLALMRAVADEERAAGVRANAIAPTAIRTAANVGAMGENARYVEREDVAAVVAWLCSDEAKVVTGQVVAL
jgi:3-oxoacyl-[acyl-carrier protein] reductase